MSLDRYQEMRDFSRTPEPAGTPQPSDGRPRFVIQRHRARRLHYDFRLEVDGVLASWAVPKGVTLDPGVRHLAVHVEDHPMDYELFEGVIPGGEYGSGDVIVWDRGTWELHKDPDPATAIENGEIHAELFGEKVKGRIVMIRTKADRSGKEQWLLLHKRDEFAVEGWDPEDHPRSVLSGLTNDEVKADPERLWTREDGEIAAKPERPERAGATDDELAELDALPQRATWTLQGRELALSNLDKALFPGRDGEAPVTKRDLVRYYARIAPVAPPLPGGSAAQPAPLPQRRGDEGVLAEAGAEPRAGVDAPLGQPGGGRGRERAVLRHRLDAGTGVAGEPRRARAAPVDLACRGPAPPHVRARRPRPGAGDGVGRAAPPRAPAPHGTRAPRRPRLPEGHRAARDPDLDPDRSGAVVLGHARLGRAAVARHREHRTGSRELEVGEARPRGTRARLDYTQNAINKTLVAPYSPRPAASAPVSAPITWEELDDPELAPDRWTIRTILDRVADIGDPMAPVLAGHQRLPPFE